MRKSRSSSSIPQLECLQNRNVESRGRERIRSVSRNSREPSADGLMTPMGQLKVPNWGSDRKYSNQKVSRVLWTPSVTPSYSTGSKKRSMSLSSFGSRTSTNTCKSPGEKVIFTNDKKWVANQFSKIQEFILTSGLFNPELAGKIKPPTMGTFVELVSKLLDRIIKTPPINVQNCAEVMLNTLRLLKYPAQLTASTLKTVNTTHGWPHFVAIIFWLIGRAELTQEHEAFMMQLEPSEKIALNMRYALIDFFNKYSSIIARSSEGSKDLLLQEEKEFYANIIDITGCDCDLIKKVSMSFKEQKAKLDEVNALLEDTLAENAKIGTQNAERQGVIEKYKENKGNNELEIKKELQQLQNMYIACIKTKEGLSMSINDLQDCIAKQKFKSNDKINLLNKIKEQERIIKRKEQSQKEYTSVRNDLDIHLGNLHIKVEKQVDNWNMAITKCFLPELKVLRLREKGFVSKQFLAEIETNHKKNVVLLEKLLKEFREGRDVLELLRQDKKSLQERSNSTNLLRQKLNAQKAEIESIKAKNKLLLVDLEECKKNHKEKLEVSVQNKEAEIRKQKEIIDELKLTHQNLLEKFDKNSKYYVAFCLETHNQIIQDIKNIEGNMNVMLQGKKKSVEELKQNVMESFKRLIHLRETYAKLIDH
ncbi:putative autophagy-related protein 11 [Euwallacea fornicatus]|uniref:putative autophagy-related protein 11 n=1 Tax=Euwallacea fornicatus TaxID=995702 RepID=UPI00338F427A